MRWWRYFSNLYTRDVGIGFVKKSSSNIQLFKELFFREDRCCRICHGFFSSSRAREKIPFNVPDLYKSIRHREGWFTWTDLGGFYNLISDLTRILGVHTMHSHSKGSIRCMNLLPNAALGYVQVVFFCCLEAIYFGWVPYGTMPVLEAHSCHKDLWMITMSHRNPLTLASLIIVSTVFSSYTT